MAPSRIERLFKGVGGWIALLLALFAMYTSGIALFDEGALRGGVIGMSAVIILLTRPLAAIYNNVSPEAAEFFDKIIESFCGVPRQKKK